MKNIVIIFALLITVTFAGRFSFRASELSSRSNEYSTNSNVNTDLSDTDLSNSEQDFNLEQGFNLEQDFNNINSDFSDADPINSEEDFYEADPSDRLLDQSYSVSSSSNSTANITWINVCLKLHNDERASEGVAPLRWDDTLANAAQEWANHLADVWQLKHSGNRHWVGENIGDKTWFRGIDSTPTLIKNWISEKKYFINGIFPNITTQHGKEIGHYTQLMWSASTKVGCGIARGGKLDYIVCQYSETGNVWGYKVY